MHKTGKILFPHGASELTPERKRRSKICTRQRKFSFRTVGVSSHPKGRGDRKFSINLVWVSSNPVGRRGTSLSLRLGPLGHKSLPRTRSNSNQTKRTKKKKTTPISPVSELIVRYRSRIKSLSEVSEVECLGFSLRETNNGSKRKWELLVFIGGRPGDS